MGLDIVGRGGASAQRDSRGRSGLGPKGTPVRAFTIFSRETSLQFRMISAPDSWITAGSESADLLQRLFQFEDQGAGTAQVGGAYAIRFVVAPSRRNGTALHEPLMVGVAVIAGKAQCGRGIVVFVSRKTPIVPNEKPTAPGYGSASVSSITSLNHAAAVFKSRTPKWM